MKERNLRAETLVEEGLQLYSQGKLDLALTKWQSALSLIPDHQRAREYLKYVEDNRTALEESFLLARGSSTKGIYSEDKAAKSTSPVSPGGKASGASTKPMPGALPEDPLGDLHIEIMMSPSPKAPGLMEQEPISIEAVPLPDDISFDKDEEDSGDINEYFTSSGSYPPPIPLDDTEDDLTPRIDLFELKAKVAESKKMTPGKGQDVLSSPLKRREPTSLRTSSKSEEVFRASSEPPPPVSQPIPSRQASAVKSMTSSGHGDRSRRATPLTLIGGAGKPAENSFEPHEETPVAICIPEPSRLLRGDKVKGGGESPLPSKQPTDQDDLMIEMMLCRDMDTPSKLSSRVPRSNELELTSNLDLSETKASPTDTNNSPRTRRSPSTENARVPFQRGTFPLGLEDPEVPLTKPASDRAPQQQEPPNLDRLSSMLAGAQQLHEQGTHEGSLWLCERVLALRPDHAEAKKLMERNRQILLKQYRTQIGDTQQVPVVQVPQHEIVWHKLDHRAGFLLSRIDGQLSFEDLLDVSGMSEFEAYRILAQLLSQGVIGPRR